MKLFDYTKGTVKWIRGGRYPVCHTVLVDDQIRAVIDASCDRDKLQAIKGQRPMDLLITSHAHEDHLLFNYLFSESKFCAHAADARHFADVDSLIDCYGDMTEAEKEKWRHFIRGDCHYQPRKVDLFLEDGMVMDLGSVKMEIIHAPGHTKGHLAFYFIQEKIMFTADLDLTRAGPYYADRTSDIEETIRSLKRLKNYDVETYLTAHGKGIFPGDPEVIDRYLDVIFLREERVVDFLRSGPKTLAQITQEGIIYGKNPSPLGSWDLSTTERAMMAKHLARLASLNRVGQEGDFLILK
jgi:glyoxylase-like metal-dependent hydrolase (beta-lactamase superfamily II)